MKRDGALPACVWDFGDSGFISTHLVRFLRQRGVEQFVGVDIADPEGPASKVEYLFGGVRSQFPVDIVDHAPSIYDLAAVHHTPGHPDRDYIETNVAGALNIAAFARRSGAQSIVIMSSIAVYGTSEELKSEESATRPISAYDWSKLLAENVYRHWSVGARGQHVIVRPAVVLGKGENGNFTHLASALEKRMFVYPSRTGTIKSCGYVGELLWSMGLLNLAAMPFEATRWLGLRNPINRERIARLVTTTNIKPGDLWSRSYYFEIELRAGPALWEEDAGGFR